MKEIKKIKKIMVWRSIGIIALAVFISSLMPIIYGPLAIIMSPACVVIGILETIDLNKRDQNNINFLKKKMVQEQREEIRRAALDLAREELDKEYPRFNEAES